MAPIRCSYQDCENTSLDHKVFSFPVDDKERLKIWLENAGNMSLHFLTVEELKYKFLCNSHFDDIYIVKEGKKILCLDRNAVPKTNPKIKSHSINEMASTSTSEPEANIPTNITKIQAISLHCHDLTVKMNTACEIVKTLKAESNNNKLLSYTVHPLAIDQAMAYTKADLSVINIAKTTMRPNRSLSESCPEVEKNYDKYRKIYISHFLEKRTIPTLITFYYSDNDPYTTLRKMERVLTVNGFISVKIPNTKVSMINEKTELVRKRHEYLSKIAKYRSEGRNIIYVEEKNLARKLFQDDESPPTAQPIHTYHPRIDHLIMIAHRTGVKYLFYYENETYTQEVLTKFMSRIKDHSVLVLGTKYYHEKNLCPLPSPDSSKEEMCNFLAKNDVFYDPVMHKAALYSIIERCKKNCITEEYTLDQLLSAYGHVVLRRPYGSHKLDFFNNMWEAVKEDFLKSCAGLSKKHVVSEYLQSVSSEDWANTEDELIETENRMFTEDLQIEECIDKILMMAKDGALWQGSPSVRINFFNTNF